MNDDRPATTTSHLDQGAPQVPDEATRLALEAMLDEVAIGESIRDEHNQIVDFVIVYVNARLVDGAGRSGDQMTGHRFCELFPAARGSGFLDLFIQVVETGEPFVQDRQLYQEVLDPDTVIDGYWSLCVSKFGDGYIAASRDVSQLVAEERVRHQEQFEALRHHMAIECLQRAALPASLPVVEGAEIAACYQPAATDQPMGGDWYDLFEFGDGRLGLVIADVAGHGPEAAAFMVQVRNVVRAFAFEFVKPDLVLAASNRMISRLDESNLFATCCYVVVDPATCSVASASAGHLPILVLGTAGRFLDGPVGPPLGVDPSARFECTSTQVQPGDRLVLFTDGLVEERDLPIGESLQALVDPASAWAQCDAPETVDRLVAAAPSGLDDLAVLCVHLAPDSRQAARGVHGR